MECCSLQFTGLAQLLDPKSSLRQSDAELNGLLIELGSSPPFLQALIDSLVLPRNDEALSSDRVDGCTVVLERVCAVEVQQKCGAEAIFFLAAVVLLQRDGSVLIRCAWTRTDCEFKGDFPGDRWFPHAAPEV